jgi:hypothetical protein
MALGLMQPLTEMRTRNLPGVKGGWHVRLTTSLPFVKWKLLDFITSIDADLATLQYFVKLKVLEMHIFLRLVLDTIFLAVPACIFLDCQCICYFPVASQVFSIQCASVLYHGLKWHKLNVSNTPTKGKSIGRPWNNIPTFHQGSDLGNGSHECGIEPEPHCA